MSHDSRPRLDELGRRPSRRSVVSHPDRSLASRLTRTSLLEPTTREVGVRPIRWSLLALPLVVLGLVFAIREIARIERVLAAEGSRAQRVIVYEVRPGGEIRVPIEPGTEVLRVVAHAVKRGSLQQVPHPARILFHAQGELAAHTDDVRFDAPGTTARVTAEDSGVVAGDPVAINVDVHGIGTGVLTIGLASIEDADGLLLRVYRREAVSGSDLVARPERLGHEGRAKLAHAAGEVDWDELERDEQTMLLTARWRRVAATPNANTGLKTRAIAVSAPEKGSVLGVEAASAPDALVDLRGDERAAFLAHGKVTLRARAEGDPDARVTATVRFLDGRVETLEGTGEVAIDVADGVEAGVELWRSSPGLLGVRASDATKLEPNTRIAAWRSTPERPVVVTAGSEPLVLRVSARAPVPRDATAEVPIVLDATISGDAGVVPQSVALRATRARSLFDRYDTKAPSSAPTTSAVFNILVPPQGTLTLAPAQGPVDLTIAELDPGAAPRPVTAWPAEGEPPKVKKTGELTWGGYVVRRPTNHALFTEQPEGRVVVRVPHRLVAVAPPQTKAPSFRVKRPGASDSIVRHGLVFDPTTVTFEIDVPPGEALVLPVRAFAHEALDLIAKVDGDLPDRRTHGVAERVTTARKIAVEEEVRTVVVLGDDLPAGTHTLTFVPPPGKKAWVHLPWLPRPRAPGAPPPDPHWIEGDLED